MKEPSKEPSYENRNSDLMNAEIYNALLSAGVAINEAERAAKASAQSSIQYIQLNQKIDGSVAGLNHKIDSSVAELNHKIDNSVTELKQDIGNLGHKVEQLGQKIDSPFKRLEQKIDSSFKRLEQKIDNKLNTVIAILIGLIVIVVSQYFF